MNLFDGVSSRSIADAELGRTVLGARYIYKDRVNLRPTKHEPLTKPRPAQRVLRIELCVGTSQAHPLPYTRILSVPR